MTQFIQWIKWCWRFRKIVPFCVGLVSDRDLTEEEFEYGLCIAQLVERSGG
jgi:hypothetical protein